MKFSSVAIFISLLLNSSILQAQQVNGQVLDAGTKQPIPYANVIFSENRGVVTNEEGYFSYNPSSEESPSLLKISSLGYEALEVSPEQINGGLIYLKPASIELGEVYLSNKNLSPKEIIKKVKQEVHNNYDFEMKKKRVFFRESNFNYVRKFDIEVDESTIPGIDQNLMNRISESVPKFSDSYKEVLGDLYGNYDSQKLRIIKAANLHNPRSTQGLDDLTDELESLFRKNLKKKSYLKIRSGIIGVKVDTKELEEGMKENFEGEKELTEAEKDKKHAEDQKSLHKGSAGRVKALLGGMFWKDDINFNLFDKTNRYKFSMNGFAHLDGATVYVINFEPKRGADYKGKIYVNTLDYGVHRLEYENVKPISSFRLFGISTRDDVYRGKMFFRKNENGKYSLSYLERESGESVGIKRPLTIIEKNKHVPGRRKQNELDIDIDFRLSQVQKLQLVVYEDEPVQKELFENLASAENFDYATLKVYNPDFWNGYNIMEPNAAIKQFVAPEEAE